jgi:uncharacterized protein with HEPN domain
MSFEDFVADKKTTNAVIRSLKVLGEATSILTQGEAHLWRL